MLGVGIASKLKAPTAIIDKLSRLKSIQAIKTGLIKGAGFLNKYYEILRMAGGSIARRKRLIIKAALEAAEKAGPVDDLTKKVIKKMVDLYHNRPLVMHFQEHHWIQQVLVTGGKKIQIHDIAPILEELNINLRKVPWNISKIPHMGGHTSKYLNFLEKQLDTIVDIYKNTGSKMTKEQMENALRKAISRTKEAVSKGEILLYNVH